MEYKPLQLCTYEHLKKAILNGEFNFDTVYSETKVASTLGVSRTPVRDALQRLNQERYVDIIPSKGFMLHKPSSDDFREACETRLAIEGFCARRLALCRKEPEGKAVIAEMKRCLTEQASIAVPENIKEFWAADMSFHHAMIAFLNNSLFEELFSNYMHYFLSTYFFPQYVAMKRDVSSLEEHVMILRAIEAGDPSEVERSVARHVDASIVLNVQNTAVEAPVQDIAACEVRRGTLRVNDIEEFAASAI